MVYTTHLNNIGVVSDKIELSDEVDKIIKNICKKFSIPDEKVLCKWDDNSNYECIFL